MPEEFVTELVGGQPVKIVALEVNDSGTTYAPPGYAYNPVKCNVAGALEEASKTIETNGETVIEPSEGKEGMSKVTVTTTIPSYLSTLTAPYGAQDGAYILTATDDESKTVVGTCIVADGAVSASSGDGTFAIDTSGDAPTLTWTPSVTAVSTACWYAASVEE